MENKWSIIPSDGGATIDENGKATFPKNTSPDDKTYIITYNDECSASATVIQNGAECEDFNFTSPSSSETLSFTSHSNVLIATTDKDFCDLVVSGSLPDFITSTSKTQSDETKKYLANINANMSDSQRNEKVKFIPTDTDFDCSFSATVKQEHVSCEDYGFTAKTTTIGYAGGSTGHVASSNSSLAALTVNTTLPSWISSITPRQNGNVWEYIATVTANTASTPNTIDITFKPVDSNITTCTTIFKTTVTQEGRNCNAYAPTTTTTSLPASQNTNFEIATSNDELAFSNNTIDTEFITATARTQSSGVYHYKISTTANPNQSPRPKTIVLKHNASGCEYQIPITQAARSCACSDFRWEQETILEIGSDGGDAVITYTGCTTPTVKYTYDGSTKDIPPTYVTEVSITSTSTTLTLASSTSEREFSVGFFVNGNDCNQEYSIKQQGSSCASQWKFTSGNSINSGWYTTKYTNPKGFGGFSFYIWYGDTEYVNENISTDDFQILTDNENIKGIIESIQRIPEPNNNNKYVIGVKFEICCCEFLNNHDRFTMYIVPSTCTETTAGKIECIFREIYNIEVKSTRQLSTTPKQSLTLPYNYFTSINRANNNDCDTCEDTGDTGGNTCDLHYNGSIPVNQVDGWYWRTDSAWFRGDVVSLSRMEGIWYGDKNYTSDAIVGDITIDGNNIKFNLNPDACVGC